METVRTCQFSIESFSYQPSKPIKTLEERREAFRERLRKVMQKDDPNLIKYPAWLRRDFFAYWSALDNDFGYKMKFEKVKSWNTKLRLNTWKKHTEKDARWQQTTTYKAPKKKNIDYGRIDLEAAKRRGQDTSIGELIPAGERLKKSWK